MLEKIKDKIIVFTDGAAKGNPGPGGWGAIVCTTDGQVSELGGGGARVTNNQMELLAIIEALKSIRRLAGTVSLFTDSTYAINGITGWVWGWKKRGWKTAAGDPVKNQDLWEQLIELVTERKPQEIDWHYVRGHIGTPGNERADAIACAFAEKRRPDLFSGSLLRYDVAIHDVPEDTNVPEYDSASRRTKKAEKPLCYLSLVDGKLERHTSWKDCEARVKGRSGAKFKKAMSESEAQSIIKGWGL